MPKEAMVNLTQFEYYQQRGLYPDRVPLEEGEGFDSYRRVRTNLYQRLLGLPLGFLNGRDVLQTGCGTGESALVLALHGANLSLVDADPTVAAPLQELFQRFSVADRIRKMVLCSLEAYQDEPIFDLVTAEGFLFTLPNRDVMLRKLCRFIKPSGLGLISFPDRFGSFLEFVKKAVMWRAYQLRGVEDVYSPQALDTARELFGPAHSQLPNPRDFEVWWEDCMVSPFLTWDECWAGNDILPIIADEGCEYYSSSPRMYEPLHLTWYKSVEGRNSRYSDVLKSYSARKFDLLFGEPVDISPHSDEIPSLDDSISGVLRSLSDYFRTLASPLPHIDFRPIMRTFGNAGVQHPLLPSLVGVFDLLRTDSDKELVDGYLKLPLLSASWGCSYQYLCFAKERATDGTGE